VGVKEKQPAVVICRFRHEVHAYREISHKMNLAYLLAGTTSTNPNMLVVGMVVLLPGSDKPA
jgi:hypothetical protein